VGRPAGDRSRNSQGKGPGIPPRAMMLRSQAANRIFKHHYVD
jgi:hypothetical protein